MNPVDLRHINLADKRILTFQTRRMAERHSLPQLAYVAPAANRFWAFWVIVRQEPCGTFAVMTKSGDFLEIENRRWLGGDKTYVEGGLHQGEERRG